MKSFTKILMGMLVVLILSAWICGCGTVSVAAPSIDYADAESFEAALNAGENLEGKIVQFEVLEFHPDSIYGYNIWAGEHLNFISSRNPDVKDGDTVVVKAETIESSLGSWFIKYEKISNAEITDATISSYGKNPETASADSDTESQEKSETSSNASSFSVENINQDELQETADIDDSPASEVLPLELEDYGWYVNESSYGDTAYVDFCAMIHNPNEKMIAEFPTAVVTVKNGDGSILATEEQVGSIVMPNDTITLCGMFTMPIADVSDDAQILFDVECDDFGSGSGLYEKVKSTEFVFSNVSERNGNRENFITGEITNSSSIDVDSANVSIVLRKDGKIVFMENTFVDGLKAGKTKAFEFQRYNPWPEHDTIDCAAMVW